MFDFSAAGLEKMKRDNPESYAVYLASYKLLSGKSANAANTARVVSNEPSLIAALGTYATTQVRVTSNKNGPKSSKTQERRRLVWVGATMLNEVNMISPLTITTIKY